MPLQRVTSTNHKIFNKQIFRTIKSDTSNGGQELVSELSSELGFNRECFYVSEGSTKSSKHYTAPTPPRIKEFYSVFWISSSVHPKCVINLSDYVKPPSEKIVSLDEVRTKILLFRKLKYNWDSYKAKEVSLVSIVNSLSYLDELEQISQTVYFVTPSPDGDIMIELENGNRAIEIEFFSDGRCEYAMFEDDNLIDEGDLDNKSSNELQNWLLNP